MKNEKPGKPGLMVMIGVGGPKKPGAGGPGGPPPPPKALFGEERQPPPARRGAAEEMHEEPEMEQAPERASSWQPTPDAVGYRTSQENCGNCAHMEGGGGCRVLQIRVEPGDSCYHAFTPREQGAGDMEYPEREEEEAAGA